MSRRSGALSFQVAAAAVAGSGLAAVALTRADGVNWLLVVLLAVVVTELSVRTAAFLTRPPGAPQHPPPVRPRVPPPGTPRQPSQPAFSWSDVTTHANPGAGMATAAAPEPAFSWDPVAEATPEPEPTTRTMPVAGGAGPERRVVQCPRCGDFGVDARPRGTGFAFACKGCAHRWNWQPGSPWPATVVRPRLRKGTGSGPG